jgi:hypothetical protein
MKVIRTIPPPKQNERETITTPAEDPGLWYLIHGRWWLDGEIEERKRDGTTKVRKIYLGGSYGLANEHNTVIIECSTGVRDFKNLFDAHIAVIFNRDDPEYNQYDRNGNTLPTTEQQKRIIKYFNEFVSKFKPIGTISQA